MNKNTNLPAAKQSIRTRTLIYFLVMALAMITLLWAVQEWFFSARYSEVKQKEIVKIMDRATDGYSRTGTPEFFADLYKTAVENNMVIYFFEFRKATGTSGCMVQGEGDESLFRLCGTFSNKYMLSAVGEQSQIFLDSNPSQKTPGWTAKQEDRFVKMLSLDQSFDQAQGARKSPVWTFDKEQQRVFYASEAVRDTVSSNPSYAYFYGEAPTGKSDVNQNILRYEFILLTVVCLLMAFVFSILLSSLLTSPIARISNKAKEFAGGDYDTKFGTSNIKEIDNLAQTLNFAVGEIGKTEQMRRDFIANISHDLRTPLTMVKAYAEMIRDISGASPEKRQLHAQVIIDEADRLSHLVGDIQNLSKVQSGTEVITPVRFDFDELCRAVMRQFDVVREKFGYHLSYQSDGKNFVRGDRDKITQVLYNLISNAVNYADKTDKRISVRQYKSGRRAVVEVSDNGKGIAEADIDAVWDRYYRANQEKRAVVGSGLGLSIVKNILVAHGAEYGVKSELGKGTTFWFVLPLAKHQEKKSAPEGGDKQE